MPEKKSSVGLGRLTYRLTLTGLIVLVAFNFGSFFYIYAVANLAQKADVRSFASILENATAKDLSLKMEGKNLVIKSSELKEWLEKYERSYSGAEDIRISSEKLRDYLKDLALSINVEPVNANLVFDGDKASAFRPQWKEYAST